MLYYIWGGNATITDCLKTKYDCITPDNNANYCQTWLKCEQNQWSNRKFSRNWGLYLPNYIKLTIINWSARLLPEIFELPKIAETLFQHTHKNSNNIITQ